MPGGFSRRRPVVGQLRQIADPEAGSAAGEDLAADLSGRLAPEVGLGQRRAAREGAAADLGDGCGDGDPGQSGAALKGPGGELRDGVGKGDLGDPVLEALPGEGMVGVVGVGLAAAGEPEDTGGLAEAPVELGAAVVGVGQVQGVALPGGLDAALGPLVEC